MMRFKRFISLFAISFLPWVFLSILMELITELQAPDSFMWPFIFIIIIIPIVNIVFSFFQLSKKNQKKKVTEIIGLLINLLAGIMILVMSFFDLSMLILLVIYILTASLNLVFRGIDTGKSISQLPELIKQDVFGLKIWVSKRTVPVTIGGVIVVILFIALFSIGIGGASSNGETTSSSVSSEAKLWDELPGWATSELDSQLNSTYNGDFELIRLNNVREISSGHYEATITIKVANTTRKITLPLVK